MRDPTKMNRAEVIGIDFYNLTITGGICKTLTGQRVDVINNGCVLITVKHNEVLRNDSRSPYSENH